MSKMSIQEALYIIDGVLKCENDPTYVAMLKLCQEALIEKYNNDEMDRKITAWPYCDVCGKPYECSSWNNDVRKLSKSCDCDGSHVMKRRPPEAVYDVIL